MNYRITFTGNSARDSYRIYTSTIFHALAALASHAQTGYNGKIERV